MTTPETHRTHTPAEIETSARQRLVFTIPNPESLLVLGSRHWDNKGVAGFTAATNEHFLFQGLADSSTFTLETPDKITLNSTKGRMTLAAKDDMFLFSEDKAYMASKNWLMISSGAEGPQKPGLGMFGHTHDETVGDFDSVEGHIKQVRKTIKTSVTYATLGATVLTALGVLAGKTFDVASFVSGTVAAATGALSATLTPDWNGDVHVFGAHAATVSSANYANLVAGNSAFVTGGEFATVFAGISAGLMALGSAGVTGGISAGLTGFLFATVTSFNSVFISSRRGDITMWAGTIDIGSATTPFPQKPTTAIKLAATSLVELHVGETLQTAATFSKNGMVLNGLAHDINADASVSINGGGSTIDVGPDGIGMFYGAPILAAQQTLKAAQSAYQVALTLGQAAYAATYARLGRSPVGYPITLQIAKSAYMGSVSAAGAAMKAARKALKSALLGVVRMRVTAMGAEMTGGLGKISIDVAGNITIDGGGLPITIKSGAASIVVGPAMVKISPLVGEG